MADSIPSLQWLVGPHRGADTDLFAVLLDEEADGVDTFLIRKPA